jgi:hypothetical protein
VDCPQAVATLKITADNAFTAYLNGVKVGNGSSWYQIYNFTVAVKCGLNNITVVVINHDQGSPAALIYSLIQNQQLLVLANSDVSSTIISPVGLVVGV